MNKLANILIISVIALANEYGKCLNKLNDCLRNGNNN